ncbi:MAG: helix-turn-helix transcriptional regulator [Candidatus Dormibacteria bacterium]
MAWDRSGDKEVSCGGGSCEPEIGANECRCDGGQPKNFLRPCLLLLLAEQPAHGYELMERLKAFGFPRDPGGLYRVLRAMEKEGQVLSRWQVSEVGPDRCHYELTPMGREWLRAWARTLDENRVSVEAFLGRYQTLQNGAMDVPSLEMYTTVVKAHAAAPDPKEIGGRTHGKEWRSQ